MRLILEPIVRFRRFVEYYDSLALVLAPFAVLAIDIIYWPKYWPSMALAMLVGFVVFYPFRHDLLLRTGTPLAAFLEKRLIICALIIAFLLILLHERVLGMVILSAGVGLSHGFAFWTGTDDMYLMVRWLAFPSEYGRVPDSIELVDKRYVEWDDVRSYCHLYRFRYGAQTSYGITRPVTFSFCEEMGSLSLDEVLEKYRLWYNDVGKKVIERDTKEDD